jgi:hypothetical protein
MRSTAYNIQHTAVQHTTYSSTTRSIQHTTYSSTAHSIQHTTYSSKEHNTQTLKEKEIMADSPQNYKETFLTNNNTQ